MLTFRRRAYSARNALERTVVGASRHVSFICQKSDIARPSVRSVALIGSVAFAKCGPSSAEHLGRRTHLSEVAEKPPNRPKTVEPFSISLSYSEFLFDGVRLPFPATFMGRNYMRGKGRAAHPDSSFVIAACDHYFSLVPPACLGNTFLIEASATVALLPS
jgi:hypothetical protein